MLNNRLNTKGKILIATDKDIWLIVLSDGSISKTASEICGALKRRWRVANVEARINCSIPVVNHLFLDIFIEQVVLCYNRWCL